MINYEMTVAIGRKKADPGPLIKQHDSGVNFTVRLIVCRYETDWLEEEDPYSIPEGCTAILKVQKPDSTCTMTDAEVRYPHSVYAELPVEATAAVGICKAEISIYDQDGERITSATFDYEVEKEAVSEDSQPSQDYFDVLGRLVKSVKEAAETAADAAEKALSASVHPPKLSDKNTWMIWDVSSGRYVDTGRGEGGADWDQNDPDGPGYVKNRTHYTEIFTSPIYRDYSVEELTETDGEMPDFPPFYGGDTVEVIVDGVKYNCVAQDITNIDGELPPEYAGSSLTMISDISFDPNLPVTPKWAIIHEDVRLSLFIFFAIDPVTLYVPGVGEVVVDPGENLDFPPGIFPSFKAGDTVTITVDGVEHSLIAIDYATLYPDADQEGATGAFIFDGDLSGWDPTGGVAPPCTWIFVNMELQEQHIELAEPQPPVPVSFFTGEYGQREEVKQIPGKYIPPSDWEQNDENGIGYIKNRPCYEELVENYVLCDYKGNAFTGGPGANYWTYVNPMPGELIVGETYAVESSNEVRQYICRLATEDDIGQWTNVTVGLPGLSPVEDDTHLTFWVTTYPVPGTNKTQYCMCGGFGWWGSTIKITGPVRVIKKLDQKFIDAPVSSVNGHTGVVELSSFDLEDGSRIIYFDSENSYSGRGIRAYSVGIWHMDEAKYGEYPIASIGHEYFLYYDPEADMFKFAKNEWADKEQYRRELTGVADPTLPESVATKNYVDSTKISKQQLPEYAGKLLGVGEDGNVTFMDVLPSIDGVPDGYVLGISDGKIAWVPPSQG